MRTRVAPVQPAASVSVHIDVVSVHGLSLTTAQTARFRAALEQELSPARQPRRRGDNARLISATLCPRALSPNRATAGGR